MIHPGEIYVADLDEAGRRPILIVSREELNRGDAVVAVLITSSRFSVRATLPNCVPFRAGQFGLTKDCVAQCENLLAIDTACLDVSMGAIGQLDGEAFRDVVGAVGHVIGADCEPSD